MTREEKQKAINALKISAPVMAVTQEEFNDYIQTLNKIMDWLEQEPRWIPVSERLPEPMQIVLVTNTYKQMKYQPVTVAQFNGRYFMWYGYQANWGKHTNIMEHGDICPGNEYVTAWMPLPEPYNAESQDIPTMYYPQVDGITPTVINADKENKQ